MDKIFENQMYIKKANWQKNRLLLLYLLNPSYVTKHYKEMTQIEKGSSLDMFLDYLTIKIVPKEKELKQSYGGFGCIIRIQNFETSISRESRAHG